VPRRLENDRWLFGVTMTLCLLGAVMIFSASAITAQHQYGHSYIFLLRQTVWLEVGLAGMFALMRMDYHRLREPAVRRIVERLCGLSPAAIHELACYVDELERNDVLDQDRRIQHRVAQ